MTCTAVVLINVCNSNVLFIIFLKTIHHHHHHHHLFFNHKGCWGTIDDFATSFLRFSLFSIALWDLANSRPVQMPWCCLPTSSSVYLVFFPLSLCLARWFWPDLMNGRQDHTTAVLCLFTMVRRSSCGPIACWSLVRTSLLVIFLHVANQNAYDVPIPPPLPKCSLVSKRFQLMTAVANLISIIYACVNGLSTMPHSYSLLASWLKKKKKTDCM